MRKSKKRMQIGISTYTYTWAFGVPGSEPQVRMTPFDLINRAGKFGLQCVQIADNYPMHFMDKTEISLLHDYALKRNIGIEAGSRGLTEENLEIQLNIAGQLSSYILRMVIDKDQYRPDPDTVVSVIRNIIPELASRKIILALENHDRLHASVFRRIVERAGSEFVGICLDCVNSMGIGEGIETVLEELAPYTVNLHVKDFTVTRVFHKMGFVVEGMPAGKGMLDLATILNKLENYGKCRSAILELWTPPENTIEETIRKEQAWAEESIENIKKMILP